MSNEVIELMTQLKNKVGQVKNVCVLTGSGVSAESGIPTFRGTEKSLWSKHNVLDMATSEGFRKDPSLVWAWYEWRRRVIRQSTPNAAHHSLAKMATLANKLTLITQNVDDLHERAGSDDVIHVHGEIMKSKCFVCHRDQAHETDLESAIYHRIEPPICAHCGGYVRPKVVWFYESLCEEKWSQATKAAETCDLFLCIGTSGEVMPAASLPELAKQKGAMVVQINPEPNDIDDFADFNFHQNAAEFMPRLLELLFV